MWPQYCKGANLLKNSPKVLRIHLIPFPSTLPVQNFHPTQSGGTESKDCLLKVGDFSGASRSFFGACRILMRTFLCALAPLLREIHNWREGSSWILDIFQHLSYRYKSVMEWEPVISGTYKLEYIRIYRYIWVRIYKNIEIYISQNIN